MSGVLFAGLAFGKAMVLSDVGGFREVVEEHGAGRLVPPEDAGALREAIARAARRPRGARAARASARARPRPGPTRGTRSPSARSTVYAEVLAMRVVFMGKSKRSSVRALDWLVERGVRRRGRGRARADEPRSSSASTCAAAAATGSL